MQSNFFDKSRTATIRIPRVFEEFLQSLADAKVRYLLIDGFAVSFHVRPRPTEDLDVWIELSEVNADAVVDAFDRFGFKNVDRNAFLVRNKIARAGNKPLRIEVLTTISGVEFPDCWPRRIEFDYHGIPIKLINRDDLRRNKVASARAKDLADVESIDRAKAAEQATANRPAQKKRAARKRPRPKS
ncbi:MAG: hypothetical protein ACKVS9_17880 [Phycisphaerae bacterium]